MKGRKPIPTGIKELRGNPSRQRLPDDPAFPGGLPECPAGLSGEAKAEWNRIIEQIRHVPGLLRMVDRSALAAYCQSWSRWIEAEIAMEEHGVVILDRYGQLKRSPWSTVSEHERRQMLSFASEFGLTPASRARVGAAQGAASGEESDFEQALRIKHG